MNRPCCFRQVWHQTCKRKPPVEGLTLPCFWCAYTKLSKGRVGFRPGRPLPNRQGTTMLNQHGDNGATFSNRADPSRSDVPVFARRVVVAVLVTVVILAIAYFLWRGSRILLLAFAGVLFALFLCALSQWTQKHTRLSYRWSLVVVVAVLLILGGGLAYLLWSRISGEVGQLIQTLPRSFEQIRDYL